MSLTPKQQRFAEEYLIDLNATQAAIRAGYSPRSAEVTASKMLRNPKVREIVDDALSEKAKRSKIEGDEVLCRVGEIATADIADAFNLDGTVKDVHEMPQSIRRAISGIDIKEIKVDGKAVGVVKKIRFWSKDRALEMLGRHFELFTDKVKHEGSVGSLGEELRERRERALAARKD